MRLKSLAAAAAFSLVAAPLAAAPSPPPPSAQRAGAETGYGNQLVGTTAWILAAIALGLIIWGIIELTDDDGPSSP